jgi:LysM repeat protein
MVTIPYWFIRYGLPTGFLVVATVAILLARAGIHEEPATRVAQPPPATGPSASTERSGVRGARASRYSVRSGDTLGTIAERFGTTVDQLIVLNPGIDPRALRVGQSIRVA